MKNKYLNEPNISLYMLLGSTIRHKGLDKSANKSLADLKRKHDSNICIPTLDSGRQGDSISAASQMLENGKNIRYISNFLFKNASKEEVNSFYLIYANAELKNLGVWREFFCLYLDLYNLSPKKFVPGCKEDRLKYLADQYQSLTSKEYERKNSSFELVTIIVPMKNSSTTLNYSIQSLLNQTYTNIEIIVVDDGSTDNSYEIAKNFQSKDSRIKLIQNSQSIGPYGCKNIALKYAKGVYITCHDSDDWSHPERIDRQIRELKKTGVDVNITFMLRMNKLGKFTRAAKLSKICLDGLQRLCFSSLLIRKSTLTDNYGQWDYVKKAADSELLQRILAFNYKSLSYTIGPLVVALESEHSLSSELSSKSLSKDDELQLMLRTNYKREFSKWHMSAEQAFPYLKSMIVGSSRIIGLNREIKVDDLLIPPQTINFTAQETFEVLKNKDKCNDSTSENELNIIKTEKSAKNLWHFKEGLLKNPEKAIEELKILDKKESLFYEAKRQGLIGLILAINLKMNETDKSPLIKKIIRYADKKINKIQEITRNYASPSFENIQSIQQDILAFKALETTTCKYKLKNTFISHKEKSSRFNLALVISSLGAGGAEKQFASWSEYLNNHKSKVFKVYAIVLSSQKNHHKYLLEQLLPKEQIIYADETHIEKADLKYLLSTRMSDVQVNDLLKCTSFVSSRTRLQNILNLSFWFNHLDIDGAVGFLDEPFLICAFASFYKKNIKISSRFGSMPRHIGRNISFNERWAAYKRFLLFANIPACSDYMIGANSTTCLKAYKDIFESCNIQDRHYAYLPNVASEKCMNIYENQKLNLSDREVEVSEIISKEKSKNTRSIVVGAIMRLSEEKRPLKYLSISEHIHLKDCIFILIGDGPLEKEVSEFIQKSTNNHIYHIPSTKNVKYWYRLINVLCLTSTVEGCPNVLLEGAMNGCALFSTDVGGISEKFNDQEHALIVDPDLSTKEMSEVLTALLCNKNQQIQLAENAFQLVKQHHNGDNLFTTLQSFFINQ